MPVALRTIAQREAILLARYAMFSADSRGRRYSEPEQAYRGPFQRDRDRVLHSAAYRRLSGKMQVFTGDMGDYHRTRLTHTQEVASIARTLGRALRLNEDLIEAMALFHDIGHPPFGHAGEDALHQCLIDDGGFSHNQFALTLAEDLEHRYLPSPGLNLSYELLEGQRGRIDKSADQRPLLEAQVVDLADSITYDAHDTDDAVKLNLVSLDELAETALIRDTLQQVHREHADLRGETLRKAVVHKLIDRHVGATLASASALLSESDAEDAQQARRLQITPPSDVAIQRAELQDFLYERVYRHPRLVAIRSQAQDQLRELFEFFCRHTAALSPRFQARAEQIGAPRATGDYLAGMTERFFYAQYQKYIVRGG